MRRRQFLAATSAALSVTALPMAARAGVRRYAVTAAPASQKLGGADRPATGLWLYDGVSPGPMIEAERGDDLEVVFTNRLDVPTTMHWHGIRNLNEMDGVPDLTQAAVEPGESFTYRFPLRDSGTFWYHAHNKGWEQLARGLYGPLVVREPGTAAGGTDITLVADDWRLGDDYQLHEDSFGSLMDWSHQGRLGNWLTVNGATDPEIRVASGKVRLRMINAANARTMAFQIAGGAPLRVVALDGAPCEPFEMSVIRLAPAQRVDVIAELSAGQVALQEVSTGDPIDAAQFMVGQGDGGPVASAPRPWYPRPDADGARVIDIHMQGGAMGNLGSAIFEGEETPLRQLAQEHSKLWAFNGEIGGYGLSLADLALGEVAVLRVWNDTRWEHAMHLHGHHFWVESREFGDEARQVLRDTYLMAAGEKADFIFVADNPGLWLFHCHMMEHHAAGMGGVIAIG
ncbi:MAG: multicopper oxidase family protein [Pseudomonadota bacterium]|nr:multicopper oxidase family protein [Pseudomonadota bacterium]